MVFKSFRSRGKVVAASWWSALSDEGVLINRAGAGSPITSALVQGFLAQLIDDGLGVEREPDEYLITWDALYKAMETPGYEALSESLHLPPLTQAVIYLQSRNSLTDLDFSVFVSEWRFAGSRNRHTAVVGATLRCDGDVELMRPEQWELFKEIVKFSRRSDGQRNDLYHRQAWGRIRALAKRADAQLGDFLHRTVVLSPERLDIKMRKSEGVGDDSVIELEPTFEQAPANWLERFDTAPIVQDRYDITTSEGIVQVLVTPDVKSVLKEIKLMPGRRVAGSRAEAFIVNPLAVLGPDASRVIDETQFEQAKDDAGIRIDRFTPRIELDGAGNVRRTELLIESGYSDGEGTSETEGLNVEEHGKFIARLESALTDGKQLLRWRGYDLELYGDASKHLAALKHAYEQRLNPAPTVSYQQIYDLTAYSSRIEGIGEEKPYYSPHIAKKNDGGVLSIENVTPVLVCTPAGASEPVAVPVTPEALEGLKAAVQEADEKKRDTVSVPWLPTPIPIREAKSIVDTFGEVLPKVAAGEFDPDRPLKGKEARARARTTLILRANIQAVDYEEQRRQALLSNPAATVLPDGLNRQYSLLPHQVEGLGWLQHLYNAQEEHQVRGAVLADDMGLGKTLQLLAFMAWRVEKSSSLDPMLVVAPLSLLENWKEETEKFIQPGLLPLLTAYGDNLARLRVPREEIDVRLREEQGLVRFLKRGWVGDARIVLTTYETLRDYEFSFAAERWSVMVCDEAQRIKNPAAMVTRAAKKQNVGFRIACTGTPVENTLADLWCLFDFVQPGLLGALNDFGDRYRKPIEAKTQEERSRVEELRALIAPQILRRTKAEVAKDLPNKIVVEECRRLPISVEQRNLYARAVSDFKRRNEPGAAVPFKNHLGLLHYLRTVCTDPRRHGLSSFNPEPLAEYRIKAPKLDWLMRQLERIKGFGNDKEGEKAIVFCEFRNIQRLLQHYIEVHFRIKVDIINGDTSVAAADASSRQKRIKAFQQQQGFGVIILSPVAVGFGVNIQAANHVIHYTRTWNPAKEDQATDRAYRIGQKKDVFVYYPVVTADDFSTFDVKLDQLLEARRALAGDILNGTPDIVPGDFNISEVVPGGPGGEIDERVTLDEALRMEWRHFEGLAAVLWAKQGFEHSVCTPSRGDKGVDVVAISGNKGVLIQTKTSGNAGSRLGWETVKDVVGGEAYYRQRHPNVEFEKVGLTNQFFNDHAHEHARLNNVTLLEQTQLEALLRDHPVTMLEIERMLYADWQQGVE
jgi:hypothetical protein